MQPSPAGQTCLCQTCQPLLIVSHWPDVLERCVVTLPGLSWTILNGLKAGSFPKDKWQLKQIKLCRAFSWCRLCKALRNCPGGLPNSGHHGFTAGYVRNGEIPEVVMSPLSLKERMLKSSARFLANVFEALANLGICKLFRGRSQNVALLVRARQVVWKPLARRSV